MPWACASTTWAMFVRTSDRGEPAKINFCNLRTDSLEKRLDSSCGPSTFDGAWGGDCIALSMKRPSVGSLDSRSQRGGLGFFAMSEDVPALVNLIAQLQARSHTLL